MSEGKYIPVVQKIFPEIKAMTANGKAVENVMFSTAF